MRDIISMRQVSEVFHANVDEITSNQYNSWVTFTGNSCMFQIVKC